ncbi:MAG: hypothetical protein QXH37_00125 [Candidatus Bathyarchaeia archaeon]
MPKTLALTKSDEGRYPFEESTFVCNGCGESFSQPILATVSSDGNLRKYYACPHCLTEIISTKSQSKEDEANSISANEMKTAAVKLENNIECKNFFGYLKKRPKNTPIPEECLICDKMIECLVH